MNEPIESRRTQPMLLAQLITKQSSRLVEIVDQGGFLGRGFSDVMIDDQPIWPIQSLLEGQISHPPGFFPKVPLPPIIVIARFQPDLGIEKFSGQALQQDTGDQPIEIALMSQNY